MPTTQPASADLFSTLASKYGINAALALLPLLSGDASGASKGFAAANLAGTGAQAAGALSGSPTLGGVGQGLGAAAGLAGTGYNISQIANNPNLSTQQKVGHSGRAATDALLSLLIPYYGAAKAVQVVGQLLERSGSPQVRGAGTALDYAAEPGGAKAFWSVAQGDKSPKAAAKGGDKQFILDLLGPLGIIARGTGTGQKVASGIENYGPIPFGGKLMGMLGIGSKPTTGTQFRHELGSLFDRIPALKGIDLSKYNMPTGGYGQYAPGVYDKAMQAGSAFAGRTADAARNPAAYSLQGANILLNKYGNQLPSVLAQLMQPK
jgi:hypothetical protein